MKIGIVVFARLDSRRLPGKALLKIGGREMLGRVTDLLRHVDNADGLVIATSTRSLDDPIEAFARGNGTAVFRGDADDVLNRALACAESGGYDAIVRISGDSPFIDPQLVTSFIDAHRAATPDITTNLFPRTYPPGMSIEVISTRTLARLADLADAPGHHEHVTTYVYAHPDAFDIRNIESGDASYSKLPLTVDTPGDLEKADWLVRQLAGQGAENSLQSILPMVREWHAMPVSERKVLP